MLLLNGLLFIFYHVLLSAGIVIDLPHGSVNGTTSRTLAGTKYHSFLAMRYAEPPTDLLRFQPPSPVKAWKGIYDATYEKYICYQIAENSDLENEDCLYINVFTPKNLAANNNESDLVIMAYIHGGGFVSGAGYMSKGSLGPKFFMDANVILVTFNYRLGPLGFLSTGDEVLPGNLGLKDQQLALEWVQGNIAYFGGDPKKVTIFGQSSGGSSVGYHLISPLSQGLFRAAILESGSALSPMAYQRNETYYTLQTIKLINPNYNFTNSTDLLAFLQSVPASDIDLAGYNLTKSSESAAYYQISKGFFYAPIKEVPHNGAFLTEPQYESFASGKYNHLPVLIGNTDEESLALARLGDLSFLSKEYDANPSIMVPFDMHINNENLKIELGSKILNYFAGARFNNDSAKIIKYHSVHDLDKGNVKQAELMALYNPVYFYQFSYSGKMGNNAYSVKGAGKVMHSEELNYIFSRSYSTEIPDNSNLTQFPLADRLVHYRMMSLWTNFAKYLDPTPLGIDEELLQGITWQPIRRCGFKYLDIDENLVMKFGYPKPERYKFWTDLYNNYAVPPLDTF
ncbi:unnamed protein product [Ceutorhynchus assimilis]|uniref:Carboxylic ester hydrolase n=1 Tax=Ceutorhynchus assimilis TaxID=467358 RepID=A0A9N9MPX3_9CUCU|nr:unnamed protein product [Ceutorhynchus assimilis]